jgi:hypothetical protein
MMNRFQVLLSISTRAATAGAAALNADPTEAAIARQLLQPCPPQRPSAAQAAALLSGAGTAPSAPTDETAAEKLHVANGWATMREMGLAVGPGRHCPPRHRRAL